MNIRSLRNKGTPRRLQALVNFYPLNAGKREIDRATRRFSSTGRLRDAFMSGLDEVDYARVQRIADSLVKREETTAISESTAGGCSAA